MKKIAVFFKESGAKDYPFTKGEYWSAYQELDTEIRDLGAEFFITRGQNTYLGDGKFSRSWQFRDGDLIDTGKIIVDKIYDKGELISDETVPVLNCKFINDVCTDKFKTYELFKEFCPQTILVRNEAEFLKALVEIHGEIKVMKPVNAEEGHGVFIGDAEYLKKCSREFPLLVQEFLDSSGGIPGIVKGIHDLRIALLNGKVIYAFVRTPPTGGLLANVAQGGSLKAISFEKIPDEAIKTSQIVDKEFQKYGERFFGVDLAFTKRGIMIIELNSRIGLFENRQHTIFKTMKQKLAQSLVNS